jgi:hypothetical protein
MKTLLKSLTVFFCVLFFFSSCEKKDDLQSVYVYANIEVIVTSFSTGAPYEGEMVTIWLYTRPQGDYDPIVGLWTNTYGEVSTKIEHRIFKKSTMWVRVASVIHPEKMTEVSLTWEEALNGAVIPTNGTRYSYFWNPKIKFILD